MKDKKPDTLETLASSDLVSLSRNLLESVIESTNILEPEEMTEAKLKEAKVVLGYLNAANNTMKTKMQFFKMTNLRDKVNAVKQLSRDL